MSSPDDHTEELYAGAMLYGSDFLGADLDGKDFSEANMDNARLNGASLRGACLRATRLCEASLRDANLEGADLQNAVLGETTVAGANFRNADLRGACLLRLKGWEAIATVEGANIHGVREAPEGFVAWALSRGAVEVAPPPTPWEIRAERAWAVLQSLGRAVRLIGSFLELLPISEKRTHRRIARRGARAIEKWRTRHDLRHLNLERASLPRVNLSGAPLAGSNLRGIDLSGANLCGAVLGEQMEDANFSGADLSYATVSGDLQRANLTKATLKGAMAMMANFTDANLTGASLEAADFSSATLTRTNLTDADCTFASFDGATIREAELNDACMADAIFHEGAILHCDLSGVDFARANLTNTNMEGCINYQKIRNIKGASIAGVRNAPEGFVAWALEHGAVEEYRNRSWTPLDDQRATAEGRREEIARRKRERYSARRTLWAPFLVGVLFFVTGLGGIIWGALLPAYRAAAMLDWEAVNCEVRRSGVEPVEYPWLPAIDGISLTRPVVSYRYQWKDSNFDGHQIRVAAPVFTSKAEVEAFAERYPEESITTCFVNLGNPKEAVLEKEPLTWTLLGVFLASLLWTAAGAGMIVVSAKHYDRSLY